MYEVTSPACVDYLNFGEFEGWHDEAMSINDDGSIDDKTREEKLIRLAAAHGEEWEFID